MIIRLKDLEVMTTIGHYEWEKKEVRPLNLNIDIGIEDPQSDQLENTLNYEEVQDKIREFFKEKQIDLIETVGTLTLDILSQFSMIKTAQVEVIKKGALEYCSSVSILTSRSFGP